MSVHSARLGYDSALGTTGVTLYTVPSGKRTIVKCITAFNATGSANRVLVIGEVSGNNAFVEGLHLAAIGSDGESKTILPWHVLNAGDTIAAVADHSSVSVAVSGTELDL
jgi:hypothetical protein